MMLAYIFLSSILGVTAAAVVKYEVPASPKRGASTLDATGVGISVEFSAWPYYYENITNLQNCLGTLKKATGSWPGLRIGGTSEDRALFSETLDVPFYNVTNTSYFYSAEFVKMAARYEGKVILGLNRGGNDLKNTIEAAKYATQNLPNLHALELGNEPVTFSYFRFPVTTTVSQWNGTTEAQNEAEWQVAVGSGANRTKLFQAGNYVSHPENGFTAATLLENSNENSLQYIKNIAHHHYPQSVAAQAGLPPPNLEQLMSHKFTVENVSIYTDDLKAVQEHGLKYFLGETNSVSGGGSPIISETFGAALWVLDYTLQAMAVGFSRLYFHQGGIHDSFYNWFTSERVTSPFYGAYTAATAIGGGSYIQSLDSGNSNYAGYAIYSGAKELLKAVLINTDYYDGTGSRPSQTFVLAGLHGHEVKITKLTAPSALSQQKLGSMPNFGGQVFSNSTCTFAGPPASKVIQVIKGEATFTVGASEALLLKF